jgi:hypothetical protein
MRPAFLSQNETTASRSRIAHRDAMRRQRVVALFDPPVGLSSCHKVGPHSVRYQTYKLQRSMTADTESAPMEPTHSHHSTAGSSERADAPIAESEKETTGALDEKGAPPGPSVRDCFAPTRAMRLGPVPVHIVRS